MSASMDPPPPPITNNELMPLGGRPRAVDTIYRLQRNEFYFNTIAVIGVLIIANEVVSDAPSYQMIGASVVGVVGCVLMGRLCRSSVRKTKENHAPAINEYRELVRLEDQFAHS